MEGRWGDKIRECEKDGGRKVFWEMVRVECKDGWHGDRGKGRQRQNNVREVGRVSMEDTGKKESELAEGTFTLL